MAKGMSVPSVMRHAFRDLPQVKVQRSVFDRSRGYKTTFDSGYLIPFYCDEALPGDSFNVKVHSVCRALAPLMPVMDNMFLDFFFFAVPNRLLWTNWQRFMGERDPDPDSSIDYTVPVQTTPVGGYVVGSLADYMGIPTEVDDLDPNALHFRAYNLIYNHWFRSEMLQDSVVVDLDDGPDTDTDYVLLRRGKRFDYFTSCLPWPQRGEAVDLPLGTTAPVMGDGNSLGLSEGSGPRGLYATNALYDIGVSDAHYNKAKGWTGVATGSQTITAAMGVVENTNSGLICDLSDATASTINSLREAFQLQRMMEREARSGTRYTEIIRSAFGVVSPDSRMQRPEYLGGGSSRISVQPIAQTSEDGTTPQGTLAAIAFHGQTGVGFSKSFTEHCVLLGIVNVRADLTYQTGLHRMWSRQTRYDFFWRELAHLGEQEVLNKEIYAQGTSADDQVFGYNERWSEYRYGVSLITGALRSSYSSSLDVWHLSQDFSSLPVLNASFIVDTPPLDRVLAVATENEFVFDAYLDVICTRPMPTYSVPGLIDHF